MMNVYSKAKTVLGGDCLGLYRFRFQAALDDSLSSNRIVWHHSKGEKRFLRLICACTGAKQVCVIYVLSMRTNISRSLAFQSVVNPSFE